MGKQARVGTLVAGGLGLLCAGIFLLGRQEHLWERKVDYRLAFARTNGLQAGAPVSLSGLPIGSVDSLHFADNGGPIRIEVAVRIDAKAAPRIRTDTRATIRTLGMLGDKYIELVPGAEPGAQPIAVGGMIPAVDPTDYEALFGQSGDIVTNIAEVSTALKDVLQSIQRGEGLLGAMLRNREFGDRTLEDMQSTIANLRTTTAKLDNVLGRVDRGEGVLGSLLHDSKDSRALVKSLSQSVQSLERVTNRLDRGRGLAMRLVDDAPYGEKVLDKLDRTATDLAQITDKLNRGEGTLGKLLNDDTLYQDSAAMVREVRGSWVVRLYEAVRGLWPFEGSPPNPAPRAAP